MNRSAGVRRGPSVTLAWLAWLVALGAAAPTHAQDSHYWTEQYGTRANLLGGVVIGSASDASATYYNPGALGLFAETSILVAARAWSYVHLRYPGSGADGGVLSSSRFKIAPDFISGEIPIRWLGSNRLAYSLLTRHDTDFEFRTQRSDTNPGGGIPTEPVSAELLGVQQRFSEHWVGLTWSKPLSSHVGLGVTGYGAIRSQQWRLTAAADQLTPDGSAGTVSQTAAANETADFWNVRVLAKMGFGFEFEPLTLGLTLTTPSMSVMGSGELLIRRSSTGFSGLEAPYDQGYLLQYQEDGLDTVYRSNWALGLGLGYRIRTLRIHCSAEWFDAVPEYTVLRTERFHPQSGGPARDASITHSLRSVWNWGVGLEFPLSTQVKAYSSFTQDRSAANRNTLKDLSVSEWNIQQLTAGVEVGLQNDNALTVGLAYAWGRRPLKIDYEFSPDTALPSSTSVEYLRIKLLLGLSLRF